MTLFSLLIAPFLVSASGTTDVQKPPATWANKDISVSLHGNAVKKNVRNKPFTGEVIYTTNETMPGNIAFICMRGKLLANVSTNPVNFGDLTENWPTTRRARVSKPALYINGEKQKSAKWTYAPRLGLFIPQKTYIAKKLYNAAIRGDAVMLKSSYKGETELQLPKPNAAFADFGAGCGLGRKKDDDS